MADDPTFLGDGHTPRRDDTQWAREQKILGAIIDGNSGGGSAPAGQGFNVEGNGPVSAAPSDPTRTTIYTDRLTGRMQTWIVQTQTWTQP